MLKLYLDYVKYQIIIFIYDQINRLRNIKPWHQGEKDHSSAKLDLLDAQNLGWRIKLQKDLHSEPPWRKESLNSFLPFPIKCWINHSAYIFRSTCPFGEGKSLACYWPVPENAKKDSIQFYGSCHHRII